MSKIIDCFFIGHNEMSFAEYEKSVRDMGVDSAAYRDLVKNFIRYHGKPYHLSEIFNAIRRDDGKDGSFKPLTLGDTFSLAVAYLGTYLHRRNLTFDYVNTFQDEKERLAAKLAEGNIVTVAIITTLYISVFPILEIVEFIKKHNNTARIIIGGPFVSNQIRGLGPMELDYLFTSVGADFYVNSSQGEAALVKIINAVKNNRPPDGIPNIYYKANCGFRQTPVSREDNRLTENMVNWDLFASRVGRHISVRTSISCPFSCTFCGFPQHAGRYQTAGVEEIRGELDLVNKIPSVRSVQFIDDTFNVPVKRFKEILGMIVKSGYKFRWHSHFRCQFADKETVKLMKDSGCEGVFLGIESGSNRILKIMNKAASVEKYLEGIVLLKEYGIPTYGSFIIGFPGETDETVEETVSFIKKSGIDFYRAQLWYCDPMTPIWLEREKYRIEGSHFEWTHATFDSKRASDVTDDIFLSVREPVWIPQYNFEYDGYFHLLHRGLEPDRAKNFIKAFNNGIKEKLTEPSHKDVSRSVIEKLETALGKINGPAGNGGEKKKATNDYDADFAFN